jgi:hypothetical protein
MFDGIQTDENKSAENPKPAANCSLRLIGDYTISIKSIVEMKKQQKVLRQPVRSKEGRFQHLFH